MHESTRSHTMGSKRYARCPYHDEPLSGERAGQRSIRLSKAYRAFYRIEGTTAKLVRVSAINKHEY